MWTRSQRSLFAVTVLVFGVFVVGMWTMLSAGGWLGAIRPPASTRLYIATGEDSQACSGTFSAPDSWELRWIHNGEIREIRWTNQAGHSESVYSMHRKPIRNHGSVNVSHGGEYQLEVVGTGDWTLEVYDLEAPR